MKSVPPLSDSALERIVKQALKEDRAFQDVTSQALISDLMTAKSHILSKEPMVVAGISVAKHVFHTVDPSLRVTPRVADGTPVEPDTPLITIQGNARAILQAERVALNFMQRLSGISTFTRQYCEAVKHYPTKIVDTRKTTPGLRMLEKWAVRLGGGNNHRSSLQDGILIKDNHLKILAKYKISLSQACKMARQHAPHGLRITVEVETLSQVRQAIRGQADIILLDNMSPSQVMQAIPLIQGRALVEVSGGISLQNVGHMAKAGANYISIGALTHSAPSKDLSLEIVSHVKFKSARKSLENQ